jgi:glyceraldehyde-3-phosphate dehydrogenase (NAD(P))
LNGYGVIGKRVADAVTSQDDMELLGIADIATDWRMKVATQKGYKLFASAEDSVGAMRNAGLKVAGTLDDLLGKADVVVDCTPKRLGAKNAERYRRQGVKFILQGGEKHEVTGHSFVAEASYSGAVGRESTRVVSCNTTSVVRTLTALKHAGLLRRARGTLMRRATDP